MPPARTEEHCPAKVRKPLSHRIVGILILEQWSQHPGQGGGVELWIFGFFYNSRNKISLRTLPRTCVFCQPWDLSRPSEVLSNNSLVGQLLLKPHCHLLTNTSKEHIKSMLIRRRQSRPESNRPIYL
jgi:hypothetical protein